MEVEKLIAFAVVAAVLVVVLRQSRPEQGMILSILAAVLLFLWILRDIAPVLEELKALTGPFHFHNEAGQILLKTLGICFLAQTGADVCRDAGESSLAGKIELAGKTAVLLLCLPLFRELLDIAARLIQ